MKTFQAGGEARTFAYSAKDGFLESLGKIPEPHAWKRARQAAGSPTSLDVGAG